jgi:plastocyanin
MRQRFTRILPILFLLAVPGARAATHEVAANNATLRFSPAEININVGDTVVWTGLGLGAGHNVSADDGSFRSGAQGQVSTFEHTFDSAGSFGYRCEPHASFGMVGIVNVSGGGGTAPTAPKNLQALAHSTAEVMLTWTDSSGETGYRIERKTLGGSFQEVATAPANSTSAIVGGLEEATLYTFRIRAENGAGVSGYSNEASAATTATPAPCVESATTLCLTNGRFQVEMVWWAPGGPATAATAIPLEFAPESGLFYFVSPSNIEVLVKVLNACVPALGNKFWVFFAATTNVELTMTVIDTQTGAVKVYTNPANTPAVPVQDTNAFATCP